MTEEHQASATNGPSNVPEHYSLPQIAILGASAEGLEARQDHAFGARRGLPMSVVDG
jgi:hypothetical protein